jgi:DNA-binding HxlR family transcriptional regulator
MQPHKAVIAASELSNERYAMNILSVRAGFTAPGASIRCREAVRRNSPFEDLRMVKRTSLEDADCPVARSLDAIGDWWSLLIIRDAQLGRRRFGEFLKSLGLAKNILAMRLRTLVERGILKTAPASDGSAYQEYVLTPKGYGVFPILVALRQWSEAFDEAPEQIATILVDRQKGRPVKTLELRSQDGRLLDITDIAIKPRPALKRRRHASA